jgi:dolichol-phosphate mannosyltransferase
MDNLYIVMPAYNEEANILLVIEQWHPVVEKIGKDSKLVVVDDGSKDSTYDIMKGLTSTYPRLVPITKPNSGHGATCLYAYRYALENGADYIFQTDSDGQTNPGEFQQFWDIRKEYDFLIGSRKNREDGLGRILVSKTLKLVVFLFFGVGVEDANTPFRLMNADKLKPYLTIIPPDFFLSNVLISTLAVKYGERVKWLPISFKTRQGGINSINVKRIFKIGVKALKDFRDVRRQI